MSDTLSFERQSFLMRAVTLAALVLAMVMTALKTYAWLASDSLSMLSSALDSGLDCLSSLINFLAIRYALQPADREHRFGHGKAEDMAALVQAAVISGSALFLLVRGFERLQNPHVVTQSNLAMGVMGICIVLTLGLALFQRYVIAHTASIAVRADAAHYTMDLLGNAGVLAAVAISHYAQVTWVDPVFAMLCGAMFLHGAWKIGIEAFHRLMDHEFSDEERQRIKAAVRSHPHAIGLHELRTRQAGMRQFIQFHLDLDGAMPLLEAHRITEEIEALVQKAFPKAEIFIHQDPK